ncbi:DUF4767 domain-containing protein [Companilactobacillus huachuanensis]|uniref:DUF4767 domain-containing protein n=1 Tax=Companilactobacillus huachuanensis TaxID=2559914 RepID=A0ABW1RKS6_9LACO|nr:DUF4767 domain-containing protein [Companilactobacillus huachuanensis]
MRIIQIRKWNLAALLTVVTLILNGCGSQNQSKKDTDSPKIKVTTAIKKKHKSQVNTKKSIVLWDTTKDNQLESFIDQWAPTMKQSYVKYDGTNSLKTSTGTSYPDDLSKVTVEGTTTSIGLSKDGSGSNSYNVVAMYNYNGTVPPLPNHITYFFAFHNGQPIVLVDQSRDGTPNLTETENTKVKSGFADIVAGKKVSVDNDTQSESDNKESAQLTTDPKMIGIMVYQLTGSDITNITDLLGVYISGGKYWIGTGTSVSNIGFTIDGQTVTYYTKKYNDETEKDDLIPNNIRLSDLENKYYSTNDQKQTIQSVAGKMPAIQSDQN